MVSVLYSERPWLHLYATRSPSNLWCNGIPRLTVGDLHWSGVQRHRLLSSTCQPCSNCVHPSSTSRSREMESTKRYGQYSGTTLLCCTDSLLVWIVAGSLQMACPPPSTGSVHRTRLENGPYCEESLGGYPKGRRLDQCQDCMSKPLSVRIWAMNTLVGCHRGNLRDLVLVSEISCPLRELREGRRVWFVRRPQGGLLAIRGEVGFTVLPTIPES